MMASTLREPASVAQPTEAPTATMNSSATPSAGDGDNNASTATAAAAAAVAAAAATASPIKTTASQLSSPMTNTAAPPSSIDKEQKAHNEEVERQKANSTSTNPGISLANPFQQPVSRPADAPATISHSQQPLSRQPQSEPAAAPQIASSFVAEPMEIDQAPVSPTSQNVAATNGHTSDMLPQIKTTQPSTHENGNGANLASPHEMEERSNKAVTYPGLPLLRDESLATPSRNNSLPTPGSGKTGSAKKHRCPHCQTEFTRHHNLKSHLLTHSQEKPFSCNTCSARFRRLHDLKRHTKLHTGERPHICNKCGRKFARGDALARHSKGPGGCAGRRSSAGGEDDDMDDTMEGITYQGDDSPSNNRRKSESDRSRQPTLNNSDSMVSPHHHHNATYPAANPMHSPGLLSPQGTNQQPSTAYFGSNPSTYATNNVTDSPKPLSPSGGDKRGSLATDSSYPRARSPSMATQLQQPHYSRNSSLSAPSLPPPMVGSMHNSNHLPALHPSLKSGPPGTAPALSTHALPQASGPNSGSGSSHGQNSGGSMRDILNGPGNTSADLATWEQVRSLSVENAKLKDDLARSKKEASISEQHYETKIRRLEEELKSLKQT